MPAAELAINPVPVSELVMKSVPVAEQVMKAVPSVELMETVPLVVAASLKPVPVAGLS